MARIFITGSTEGLGRAAALALLDDGHEVVLHARNASRAASMGDVADRAFGVVIGDLGTAEETHDLANQVNAIGRMDAVIHNAGIYIDPERVATPEGHTRTLAVNVLAPYVLTADIERPARLIYISSGMHRGGDASLRDIDWTTRAWSGVQAYSDSKLFVAALAFAVSRCWPDVRSNVVDPGWVPTRMGGPSAPDDLELGHVTQVWLAASDERDATGSGGYWYHRRRQMPAPAVSAAGAGEAYNMYGSSVHKQAYIYGNLDTGPIELARGFGMTWSIGGWLLFQFLAKVGPAVVAQLKARVADEIRTTFASHYSRTISLLEALDPMVIAAYARQATGEKFVINPVLAVE